MYSAIDGSTYLENAITAPTQEVYTYQSTLKVSLQDAEASDITLLGFESTVVKGAGPVVIISTEFPAGLTTSVSGTSPDWLFAVEPALTVVPTKVYTNDTFDAAPVVLETVLETTADKCIFQDEILSFASATTTEFVGVNSNPGLVEIGDTLTIATESVELTSATITGAGPYTYTLGFAATAVAETGNVTILNRLVPNAVASTSIEGLYAMVQYEEITNPDFIPEPPPEAQTNGAGVLITGPAGERKVIKRKITSPAGYNIVEPFSLVYAQKIVQP